MIRIHKQWNMLPEIEANQTEVDSALRTLPINQIMNVLGAPPSDFDDFVNRLAERSQVEGHGVRERRRSQQRARAVHQLMVRHFDRVPT